MVHGGRRHRGSGVLELGQLVAVGRRELLGQRRLHDRERLPHLHGAALELAQRLEELLGGALLHVEHHGFGAAPRRSGGPSPPRCAPRSPAAAPSRAVRARTAGARSRRVRAEGAQRAGAWVLIEPLWPTGPTSSVRRAAVSASVPAAAARRVPQPGLALDLVGPGVQRDRRGPGRGPAAVDVRREVAGRPGQRERGEQRVDRLRGPVGPVPRARRRRTAGPAAARPGRRRCGARPGSAGRRSGRAPRTGRPRRGPR